MLEWSGFEVVSHEFYEAEFGSYRVKDGQLIKADAPQGVKGKIKSLIRSQLKKRFPRLKDNHIIVAKKVRDYKKAEEESPFITKDKEEWMEMKKNFSSKV